MPLKPDDDIRLPLSPEEEERVRQVLEEAHINPADHFHIPNQPDPKQPGRSVNPNVPGGKTKETYNGQKGDGTFREVDHGWQPDCDQPFDINVSEAWRPPPAGLANKFDAWARFATFRAILICRKNQRCKLVHPLGCESSWEIKFKTGEVLGVASFVFECIEI